MRAPRNEATGTSGESEVKAEFERLGWGVMLGAEHDLGTDLLLLPRDERRFDLGTALGAQVKTGPSQFRNKCIDGQVAGWWFSTDLMHFEYWSNHAIPHIIILRDQHTNTSYWQLVTPDNIRRTSKTAKILIPLDQTIDELHNRDLQNAALSMLPSPVWEGSAWRGSSTINHEMLIRCALLVPRMVATNPREAGDILPGIEALALQVLMNGWFEKLFTSVNRRKLTENGGFGIPTLKEASESSEWTWRATAALYNYLHKGDSDQVLHLVSHSSTSNERAASYVLAVMTHFDNNDAKSALACINEALNHDDYSPVDHAWLQAQKSRALLELGRTQDAYNLANDTIQVRSNHPTDITASAIAGACAITAFYAAGWLRGDTGIVNDYYDNTAMWWRSELVSAGLSQHLSETFRTWTQKRSIQFRWRDGAYTRLRSASLVSSLAGDQNGWRDAMKQLGQHILVTSTTESPIERYVFALSMLRLAGDSDGSYDAAQYLVDQVDAQIGRLAAREITLDSSTRTTALADIKLLTAYGDVLEPSQANDVCCWAIKALTDSTDYIERTQPAFDVFSHLLHMVRSLIPALDENSIRWIIDYVLSLPVVTDDGGEAQLLAKLVYAVPRNSWTESDQKRALERYSSDAQFLREALLSVASYEAAEEIERRACAGDLMVLASLDSRMQDLSDTAAARLISRLCEVVEEEISQTRDGIFDLHSYIDIGGALAQLSVLFPNYARWDYIERRLRTLPPMANTHKGTLMAIRSAGPNLSSEVRSSLALCLESFYRDDRHNKMPFGADGSRELAVEALAAVSDASTRTRLVNELLTHESDERASAAWIISHFGQASQRETLLGLLHDSDRVVQCASLYGLCRDLVRSERPDQSVIDIVANRLEHGTRSTGMAIVEAMRDHKEHEIPEQLVSAARRHPCASVRKAFSDNAQDMRQQIN